MESMSSNIHYKGLNAPGTDNEDEDYPPEFTTLAHEQEKSKWSHIDDLDDFFTRVYQYHQSHGIFTLVFSELLNLFQIMFLALFSIFMFDCVDYVTLFQNQKVISDNNNKTMVKKNTITDVVFPLSVCIKRISFVNWLILIVVIVFWLFRLIKAIYNIARYAEIRSFYMNALNIQTKDLPNITWHEVQERLLQLQKKYHLCVHKQELTELDIYNRILRFKNYEVAMINQGLLPPKVEVPFLGQLICLSTGFKYNFEFLFFWGPFSPFRNYQLRSEFKVFSKRADLTAEIKKSILILGLFNLIMSPVIFIWQLLQFLYSYAELIKRDPSMLGIRRWSNYGKLYFRHFNELDHELEARLSRAYKPALLYLSSFNSKFLTVIAKFFVFTFGAIFAVLIGLTIYDEDVLNVEHVFTIISLSGAIAGIARSLIPDENAVYFMDQMMYQILAQVHYMPDAWKLHANSYDVRDEFVKLFQYKFVFLLEELFSPITTPFMLLFWLRPRAVKVVDFLRNFTVDVVGVGDVCSFAQMDTRRHGNVRWLSKTNAKKSFQARNGKTELSLIHFVHTNPNWKAPMDALAFIDELRDQAIKESITNNIYGDHLINSVLPNLSNSKTNTDSTYFNQNQHQTTASTSAANNESSTYGNNNNNNATNSNQNSLNKSMYHLQSLVYNPNIIKSNSYIPSTQQQSQFDLQIQQQQSFGQMPRGAVSRIEGPLFANKQEKQTLLNIAQASTLQLSSQSLFQLPTPIITTALENSLDMCFSALYMHELHRKYNHGDYIDLDNVKEENDEAANEETEPIENYYLSQKRPLLSKSVIKYKPAHFEEDDEEADLNEHNVTLTNKSNDSSNKNAFNTNRLELKNELKPI